MLHNSCNCLVDTTLEVHRVGTCCNVLQALSNDSLCEDGSCCSTVTSIVTSLACNALYELCASVLELVVKLHFLSNGNTVLSDLGSTELLLDNYVAAFRAKCNLYGVSQLVDTVLKQVACIYIVFNLFSHFR